jgi:hypothetical protein
MCDLVYAAQGASFGHPAGRGMGIPPAMGLLPMRIGAARTKPKLPSLRVDIWAPTCDNAVESKVFLHRKSAAMTSYHDGSLRWSDHVARRHDLRARKGPGQRRDWHATAK